MQKFSGLVSATFSSTSENGFLVEFILYGDVGAAAAAISMAARGERAHH
jgi:hypothetical protein